MLGDSPAGKGISALSWVGPADAPFALKQLRIKLPKSEWDIMCAEKNTVPNWMTNAINTEMKRG